MVGACRVRDNKVIPIRDGIIISVKENITELLNRAFVCANCGFGTALERKWRPVMETSCCPMCGSQKKR